MASGFAAAILASSAEKSSWFERYVDLVRDLALEEGLEAGERVLARLVVGRHQERFLDAGVLGMLARDREDLIVLVGGDEEVRIALLAGEVRGAGIGADQDGAALGHGLHDRGENVGKDRADDEIDLVPIDQRLDLVHGEVGLELVVRNDHLDIAPAELAVEILDRKIEAVAKLLTEHGRRSGQGGNDADLELFLPLRSGPSQNHRRGGEQDECLHVHLLSGSVWNKGDHLPSRVIRDQANVVDSLDSKPVPGKGAWARCACKTRAAGCGTIRQASAVSSGFGDRSFVVEWRARSL